MIKITDKTFRTLFLLGLLSPLVLGAITSYLVGDVAVMTFGVLGTGVFYFLGEAVLELFKVEVEDREELNF
jgi:hypothetical protein